MIAEYEDTLRVPVIAAALISLLAIAVTAFTLKQIPVYRQDKQSDHAEKQTVLGTLKLPFVRYFMFLYFLIFLAFNLFYSSFPVYVASNLHWSSLQLGLFFSFLSAMLVLVQGPLLNAISGKVSSAVLIIAGAGLLAVGFSLFMSSVTAMIYSGAIFFALGNGIMWPSFLALLSITGQEHSQGLIQGLASSAGSIASIVGLISGAVLYRSFGAMLFLIAGVFMVLIGLICLRLISIEKVIK